jgi:hypothetical protein
MPQIDEMNDDERMEWFTQAVAAANAGMDIDERSHQEWSDFVEELREKLFT